MKKTKSNTSKTDNPWQLPDSCLEQTIAQIEKRKPGRLQDGNHNISGLTRRVFHIEYKKKIKELTGEDLGCMLDQQFSLNIIVPLVIEMLHKDIMAEGYYPGHLVKGILNIHSEFWQNNPDLWTAVQTIITSWEKLHTKQPMHQ